MARLRWSLTGAILATAPLAFAASIRQSFPFDARISGFPTTLFTSERTETTVLNVNGFDPALGRLDRVVVEISLRSYIRVGFENSFIVARQGSWDHFATASLGRNVPGGSFDLLGQTSYRTNFVTPVVPAWDGVTNYLGPSSLRVENIGSNKTTLVHAPGSFQFNAIVGAGPKECFLALAQQTDGTASNSINSILSNRLRGTVVVTYLYTP
ncbi:MAG: choice-of-anchor E domain-containing protein [Fimbriimonadaceae bacterium]|nr:choice-of-anchor E domain-containing protein [Fimbriimonadaceae bacterium]